MKKTAQAKPNIRLKEARELRGWSQKYVADEIGADRYYLSRWEHGTASPSPYYRQKLCALFGKNARELGLLPDDVREDSAAHVEPAPPALASHSPGPIYDPAIPALMPGGRGLVGRDELLQQLKEHLRDSEEVALSALNGLPGVGKTSLAVALAHDPEIVAHFSDGILWAGLGPAPNVLSLLSHWGMLLGLSSTEIARMPTIEEWAKALHMVIGSRKLLLVIDDAWRIEAALAFKVGGPNCAYLVTTRFPQIALRFASHDTLVVHELTEEDGLTLLSRFVPDLVRGDLDQARSLVRAVGGLPLALTIIGGYLRTQSYSGQPRRIFAATRRLQDAYERLLLTEPQAPGERPPGLPRDTPVSLQTVIAVGDQQLDEQERDALRALAVFPPKPNSFTEEAACAITATPVETLDRLSDAGLLESSEPGRYTLHQTIADYARIQLSETAPRERLATYFAAYVEVHASDYEALEQERTNIAAALDAAFALNLWPNLLQALNGLVRFWDVRGRYALAEKYLQQAREVAISLDDRVGLTEVLLHLGEILMRRGDYARAEAHLQEGLLLARQGSYKEHLIGLLQALGMLIQRQGDNARAETLLQEGLALARETEDQARTGVLLKNLGTLEAMRGNYARAEIYLQEGLEIARQVGDREALSQVLLNLGQLASERGDNQRAEALSLEALSLAQQIGHREVMTLLLTNLGVQAGEQNDFVRAENYLNEGLEMARQIGYRERISLLLTNLGWLASEQEHYAQAEEYLQESLALATDIGNRWLMSGTLKFLGDVQVKLEQFDAARSTFHRVLELAAGGNQRMMGEAHFGLAIVSAAQGNLVEARSQAEESLAIYEKIGQGAATRVREWLSSLPDRDARGPQ